MENTQTQLNRQLIKREYYLLGIRKLLCKKDGPRKGTVVGIVELQEERYFDDGTNAYSIESVFVDVPIANAMLEKNIPHRSLVTITTEQADNLYARPKLIDINLAF